MKLRTSVLLVLFVCLSPFVGFSDSSSATNPSSSFHSYQRWSAFLKEHVSNEGKVNYSKIKQHSSALAAIISEFENNFPSSDWSRNQRLAYWINVYNLYTIKLVSDHYPVQSIRDITSDPWKMEFIHLGGKTYSLNYIENSIIRPQFKDAKIHFALNCASASCPKLLNEAYRPETLSSQLVTQTKIFLNDSSKNDFSNPSSIRISSIFDWYRSDFERGGGTVVDFINKFRSAKLSNPRISYLTYSWELND